jgi:RNA polymerase sigma-70 factor, ECF subfamily
VEPLERLSDEELVELCGESFDRTREIFAILYERYRTGLFNFLKRYTGSSHAAEDVLQETFLRVFRNLRSYQPGGRMTAWIHTIALNAARDLARKRKPEPLATDDVAEERGSPADGLIRREEEAELSRRLVELPEEERVAFILSRLEGRPLQEVADVLGVSLRTAKNRLASALERLVRGMEGVTA